MKKGLILCVCSQCLFGTLYFFSYYMQPLTGTEIFALRMLVMAIGVWGLALITIPKRVWQEFCFRQLGKHWGKWGLMLLGTLILASQLWLFMWAPINQQGANVAMGYFLFPLVMVLAGKFVWKEQLKPLQQIAILSACCGVFYQLIIEFSISWATLWVALVYPPYYLSRRAMKIPALLGLLFDVTLIFPFVLAYLYGQTNSFAFLAQYPSYLAILALLGIVSTLAMYFNLSSSSLLPVNIFGMLSYLEPALLFLCAVFWLDTPVSLPSYISYSFIWLALILLALNGYLSYKKSNYPQ